MGGSSSKGSLLKHCIPGSKFEDEIVVAMQQRELEGSKLRSFDSVILKFPKIDESLKNCKTTFQKFDKDSNGLLDTAELKNCLKKLGISFLDEEIGALFEACDINRNKGIEFNEFVVLLCIVYLLQERTAVEGKSRMGLPHLEKSFETLVDAFVFLDKNKDGYVSKNELIDAMNENSTVYHTNGLGTRRFEEMDWDKDGTVSFKEFLFAFTRWIGMEEELEEEEEQDQKE